MHKKTLPLVRLPLALFSFVKTFRLSTVIGIALTKRELLSPDMAKSCLLRVFSQPLRYSVRTKLVVVRPLT